MNRTLTAREFASAVLEGIAVDQPGPQPVERITVETKICERCGCLFLRQSTGPIKERPKDCKRCLERQKKLISG